MVLDNPTSALGLKIAPLEYRTTLKGGEVVKGFIDISNPENQSVTVRTSVQAFKQIDDKGTLKFYEDEQLKAGVKLDLDDFELGPREAIRMYFLLDSKLLPSGDIFGGIFFTTEASNPKLGSGQSLKIGTILSIVNGTPGSRKAEITGLTVPSFHVGDTISGTFGVKNTGNPETSTGFYPEVTVKVWPFGDERTVKSNLVFAQRSRDSNFSIKVPPLGVYKVSSTFGASEHAKLVVVAHPLALVLLGVIALVSIALSRVYVLSRRK